MAGVSIVAKRLKEARLRVGISQKQLGIKARIDDFSASARINQYERGKHTPDLQTVIRLAAVLDVPAAFFYCEDSELAEVIVKFAALGKAQRKRVIGLLGES
jgi:transcriptional regulator with XRE-family HTH domain